MKKILFCLLFALAATGCSSVFVKEYHNVKMVQYRDIQKSKIDLSELKDAILVMQKGDRLPIRVGFNSSFANLIEKKIHLKFNRKIFIRFQLPAGFTYQTVVAAKKGDAKARTLLRKIVIYLSVDAKRWSSVASLSGVKDILGVKRGSFSVGLSFTKSAGLAGALFLTATK